jgi:hypothetical protein
MWRDAILNQGCQIFVSTLNQSGEKYTKLTTKYTIRPLNTPNGLNIPNGNKIYRNTPFQGLQNYTRIGIFGLKICHLATPI